MKKLVYIASALIFSATLAGCVDSNDTKPAVASACVSLTAGIESTRTDISTPGAPVWTEGDAIGVHIVSGTTLAVSNKRLDSTLENGGSTATFAGNVTDLTPGSDYTFVGYYPHSASAAGSHDLTTDTRLEIPAVQQPTATSFDPKADIMVMYPFTHSHTGADISYDGLYFKRMLGMVRIVLNSSDLDGQAIRQLTFTTDDENLMLSGLGSFDLMAGEFTGFYQDAATSVSAEPAADIFANGSDAMILCVPAITIGTNVTMTITGETDDFTFTKSVLVGDAGTDPIEIVTGGYHTMSVTLAVEDITPKSTAPQTPPYARTTSTWVVGSQIWSDVINVPDCDKTDFNGGTTSTQRIDCRNNGSYGYLYSWPYVRDNGTTILCPDGWRVPTKDDFIALDKALGGSGANYQKVATLRAAYENTWGAEYGGYANGSSLSYTGSEAYYWSQTKGSANQYAFRLTIFKSNNNVSPQDGNGSTFHGLVVRCVKNS